MPDPRWTDETLSAVASVIGYADGELTSEAFDLAAGILAALAEAGLLVEPDSETREELGYRWPDGQVVPAENAAHTVNATAIQRTIRIGPWREPQ